MWSHDHGSKASGNFSHFMATAQVNTIHNFDDLSPEEQIHSFIFYCGKKKSLQVTIEEKAKECSYFPDEGA